MSKIVAITELAKTLSENTSSLYNVKRNLTKIFYNEMIMFQPTLGVTSTGEEK